MLYIEDIIFLMIFLKTICDIVPVIDEMILVFHYNKLFKKNYSVHLENTHMYLIKLVFYN